MRVFGETAGTVRALTFWFSLLFIWFCAPVNPCETEACWVLCLFEKRSILLHCSQVVACTVKNITINCKKSMQVFNLNDFLSKIYAFYNFRKKWVFYIATTATDTVLDFLPKLVVNYFHKKIISFILISTSKRELHAMCKTCVAGCLLWFLKW